jgi:phage FluMu protein Com
MNYRCKKCGMLVAKAEKETHDEEECGRPVIEEKPVVSNDVNINSSGQ